MHSYVDTSIVLSRLFNQTPQIDNLEWGAIENAYASELIKVECLRVIERKKLDSGWSDKVFSEALVILEKAFLGISIVSLESQVILRACQPFGVRLKTLDAIHLSTALLLRNQNPRKPWNFFTHDEQLKTAAAAYGFQVKG